MACIKLVWIQAMTRRPRPGALLALRDACNRQLFVFADDMAPFVYWFHDYARAGRRKATRRRYGR